MNEKYKKIMKWGIAIAIVITLIILPIFIKHSKNPPPPDEVNCCVNDQCLQLKTDDCSKQGGVPNCDNCSENPPPPDEVNCCVNDQCLQLKTDDCSKQGGVPNCDNCSPGRGFYIKDFGTTYGAITLLGKADLGIHITPDKPITLDTPTPVNTTASPDDSKRSSLLFTTNTTNNSQYYLNIDDNTGLLFPSLENKVVWSLSSSPTMGHLIGKKDNKHYFATGPMFPKDGDNIIMKEESTLTRGDNVLSFATFACTPTICTGGSPQVGLCTPGLTWTSEMQSYQVDKNCTIVNKIRYNPPSLEQLGTLKVTGDKGVITFPSPGPEKHTISSNNVNTTRIDWVNDIGKITDTWTLSQ
jgi:hypothetical protein